MPAVSKRVISLGPLTFFVAFLLVSWCSPVQGAIRPVGNVILATGTFLAIQSDRSSRSLTRGSEFYQGDRLWTGPRSKAQIRFSDGAIMTLRADTEFRVDEYEFDSKNANRNKSLFTLIKGGFRTITGLVSRLKPENYKVKTSYAIVGVRGTTFETVVDNALYVAAWQGTVSVTNEAGEATLGYGQDTNYARVSGLNRRPVPILETPSQFSESVAPGFGQEYQRLLEILPSEGTLVREGFAVFGGANSTGLVGSMSGGGTGDISEDTIIFDDGSGVLGSSIPGSGVPRVLRQGAASLVDGGSLPDVGVSWGAWAGGPVEVQTLAGTTPVARPAFWLTMAPPTSIPTGTVSYTNVIALSGAGSKGLGLSPSPLSTISALVDFAGSLTITTTLQNGTNNWSVIFNGPFSGTTYNVPVLAGTVNAAAGVTGNATGGFSGPTANVMGGVFDLEGPTSIEHVEGVFVITQ